MIGLYVSKKMKIQLTSIFGILVFALETLSQSFTGAIPTDFGPIGVSGAGGPYEINENESIELLSSITNPFDEEIETYIWSFDQNETNIQIIDNDSILDLDWSFLQANFDTSLGSDIAIYLDWIDVAGNTSDDTFDLGAISAITVVPEPTSFPFILALSSGLYCFIKRRKFNANKSELSIPFAPASLTP